MHQSVSTRSESDASVSVNWIKKWGRSSMHQCPKSTGSSRAGECISVRRELVQKRLSNALAGLVRIGKLGVADRNRMHQLEQLVRQAISRYKANECIS